MIGTSPNGVNDRHRCTHHHSDLLVSKLPRPWRQGTPCDQAENAAMFRAMDAAHEYELAKACGLDTTAPRLKLTIAELEQENLELRHRLADAGVERFVAGGPGR